MRNNRVLKMHEVGEYGLLPKLEWTNLFYYSILPLGLKKEIVCFL